MKFRLPLTLALLGAASATLAPAAHAQRIGVDGGIFFPSSSKTKSAFGSNFKSIGPGLGSVQVLNRKVSPDLDLMRQDKNGNDATVVFVGAKLLVPLGGPSTSGGTSGFAPYGGFGVNLTYADVDAPAFGVNDSGFGVGASAILGASFGTRFFVEGRYRLTTKAADFDFSGGLIGLGVRF
jgi:hypothetical protein